MTGNDKLLSHEDGEKKFNELLETGSSKNIPEGDSAVIIGEVHPSFLNRKIPPSARPDFNNLANDMMERNNSNKQSAEERLAELIDEKQISSSDKNDGEKYISVISDIREELGL